MLPDELEVTADQNTVTLRDKVADAGSVDART
jgi:hypothetical protein